MSALQICSPANIHYDEGGENIEVLTEKHKPDYLTLQQEI